jgi:hypothetical protein
MTTTILTLIQVLQDHVDNEDRSASAEGKEKLFLFVIKLIHEERFDPSLCS